LGGRVKITEGVISFREAWVKACQEVVRLDVVYPAKVPVFKVWFPLYENERHGTLKRTVGVD
jgi:hypothetical protein